MLTDSEKADMQREAGGLLHFLPRRHLECYCIDPDAIAAFIISKHLASAEIVTPAAVESALRSAAGEGPLLIAEWNNDISKEDWLAGVDAAKLIKDVCGTLSDQRVPFMKKDDSLFLLRHMLTHNPTRLTPLKEYVESLVKAVSPT